mgnify:CR=1 FL=1
MYSGSKLELNEAQDINPQILGAKVHEQQALGVEIALQKNLRRKNVFVIPYIEYADSRMSDIRPCLRVVDAKSPKADFNSAAVLSVGCLRHEFYGEQDVYVSVEDSREETA